MYCRCLFEICYEILLNCFVLSVPFEIRGILMLIRVFELEFESMIKVGCFDTWYSYLQVNLITIRVHLFCGSNLVIFISKLRISNCCIVFYFHQGQLAPTFFYLFIQYLSIVIFFNKCFVTTVFISVICFYDSQFYYSEHIL